MKLFWSIVCAGISVTIILFVVLVKFEPGWLHTLGFAWAIIFGLAALVIFLVVVDDRHLEIEEQLARIEILKDKDLKRLELYTRIPREGWPYLMSERGLVIDAKGSQPITKVRLLFGEVPQDFIEDFIKHSDPNFVRPVRFYAEGQTWNDGGNCRKYATICIQHILEKQYAGGQPNTPKHWTTNGRTQFQYEAGLGIKDLK
jgi:hypothetical protein